MPCTIKILDFNGEEIISPVNVSNEENALQELKEKIGKVLGQYNPEQLNTINTKLDNLNEGEIDITQLNEQIKDSINIVNDSKLFNFDQVESLINDSDLSNEIKQKINYLQDKGLPINILLIGDSEGTVKIANGNKTINIDGTILTSSNGSKYMLIKNVDNINDLAYTINHELIHLIMDDQINNNAEIQQLLTGLFDQIKHTKPESNKIKNIINKIKSTGSQPIEIYAWIFGDQDMYDYVSDLHLTGYDLLFEDNYLSPKGNKKIVEQNKDTLRIPHLEAIGEKKLEELGFKKINRQSNGNIRGGQSGWKIRINVKGNYQSPSDPDYVAKVKIITSKLNAYFGGVKEVIRKPINEYEGFYFFENPGKGNTNSYKHLSGGDFGDADFTIYTGSYEDTMKFINDMKKDSELLSLIRSYSDANINSGTDILLDNYFLGRIAGSDIGFNGYLPDKELYKITGSRHIPFRNGRLVISEDRIGYIEGDKFYEVSSYIPFKSSFFEPVVDIIKIRGYLAKMVYGDYLFPEDLSSNKYLYKMFNDDFTFHSQNVKENESLQPATPVKETSKGSKKPIKPFSWSNSPIKGLENVDLSEISDMFGGLIDDNNDIVNSHYYLSKPMSIRDAFNFLKGSGDGEIPDINSKYHPLNFTRHFNFYHYRIKLQKLYTDPNKIDLVKGTVNLTKSEWNTFLYEALYYSLRENWSWNNMDILRKLHKVLKNKNLTNINGDNPFITQALIDLLNHHTDINGDFYEGLPFAVSVEETLEDFDFVESSTLAPHLEYKSRSLEELKENNKNINEFLTSDYEARVKNNTLELEYDAAINTEGNNILLYGAKTGDIVQIPIQESYYWKTWKTKMNDNEKQILFGDEWKIFKDDDYISVSSKKIHDRFPEGTNVSAGLAKILTFIRSTSDKYKTPRHAIVKNYPVVFVINNNGNSKIRVPYTFKDSKNNEYKTVKDFKFDEIIGLRRFKGNYNTKLKASDQQIEDLRQFISELTTSTDYIQAETPFNDDNYDFIKNVVFNRKDGSGSFETSYIQTKGGEQIGGIKGNFGELRKLMKTVESGAFVKFSIGYDPVSKKHKMVYGEIIGNGSNAARVIYYNDNGQIITTNVTHYKITELFLPKGTNSNIIDKIKKSEYNQFNSNNKDISIKSERAGAFRNFVKSLYSKDKNVSIYNFGYISKKAAENNKNNATILEDKISMLNKIKMGSVTKYVEIDKQGKISEKIGTFFYTTPNYTYIQNGYGEIIKISNRNNITEYDKNLKSRTFLRGEINTQTGTEIDKNNYALDTIFADTSQDLAYVNYLKTLKLYIKSNFEHESDPLETFQDKLNKQLKEGIISSQEYIKLVSNANQNNIKSISDAVDVVEFLTIDTIQNTEGKRIAENDPTNLLTQAQKEKEVSQLQVGDLIHYLSIYDENKVFNSWTIIVDFDDNGLPIVAYESNGRIRRSSIKIDNIKAVGRQINPITFNQLQIKGRPEILKNRLKARENYLKTNSGILTLERAKELLKKKVKGWSGGTWNEDGTEYIKGKIKFEIKEVSDDVLAKIKNKKENVKYGVNKYYQLENGSWSKPTFLKEYILDSNEVYSASQYSFDEVKDGIKLGSILEVKKTWPNKGDSYYTMIVEKISQNVIKGYSVYQTVENGELVTKEFPVNIYRSGKIPTMIRNIYKPKYNGFKNKTKNENIKTNSITKINKSEVIKNILKTRDSKKDILHALDKISSLYGVETVAMNNREMYDYGIVQGYDLSNARGFVNEGKIYINVEKASIAEAFHEMGHLIMPGLKSLNSKAWNVIKSKVKEHPTYQIIAEKYNNLDEDSLVEETFVTIFGEYYRNKYLSNAQENWINENDKIMNELTSSTGQVISDLFNIKEAANYTTDQLMQMSLNELMIQFGNAMMEGSLNVYFKEAAIITANINMKKLFKKLIDEGKANINC